MCGIVQPQYVDKAVDLWCHSKMSNFDGGIRTASFISGGFLPEARRGSSYHGLVSIADWYSISCGLAGAGTTDHAAAAVGLPPVDGIDLSRALVWGDAGSTTCVLQRVVKAARPACACASSCPFRGQHRRCRSCCFLHHHII
jgi:hypothetical protein